MGKHMVTRAKEIKMLDNLILTGTVLAIDPASKSVGYALYHKGELVKNGTLEAPGRNVTRRLAWLYDQLSAYQGKIDLLAIEEIRGRMAHTHLIWAVGLIVAAIRPDEMVEVPITMWKALCPPNYIKSDANDAAKMGEVIMNIARSSNGKEAPWQSERIRKDRPAKAAKSVPKKTTIKDEKRFNKGHSGRTGGRGGVGAKRTSRKRSK